MANDTFKHLWQKYMDETMQPEEFRQWSAMVKDDAYAQQMDDLLEKTVTEDFPVPVNEEVDFDKIYNNILQTEPAVKVKRGHFLGTAWFRYAAAFILLVGTGAYFWFGQHRLQNVAGTHHLPTDIAPGKEGAILTLADGTQVLLDSMSNGMVAMQNNTQLMLNNGQLAYNSNGEGIASGSYNTVTTPNGRQFQLVLPDGSRVWLNAASSVKFPVAFKAAERRVELQGEAYFEIKADPRSPFSVIVNETQVQVLGTSFNVNGYVDEESVKTTLIEGAVRVAAFNKWQLLKPGQQSSCVAGKIIVQESNINQVTAWKNGVFDFTKVSLDNAMRQLAKWYDVEVVYEKGVPPITFWGKMGRNLNLSEVLESLEQAGVHFRLDEARRLVVIAAQNK